MSSVKEKSEYLSKALVALSEKHGLQGERGEGLLRALKLGSNIGGALVEAGRNMEPVGVLLNSPRPDLLRFMPALNVSIVEIDQMISMLDELLTQAKK